MKETQLFVQTPFKEPLVPSDFQASGALTTEDILEFVNDSSVLVRLESQFSQRLNMSPRHDLLDNQQILLDFRHKYDIAIPDFQYVEGLARGKKYFFTIVDKVDGVALGPSFFYKIPDDKSVLSFKLDQFFKGLASYAEDTHTNGGLYNFDIFGYKQYVYGRTKSDPVRRIYLVDIAPNISLVPEHFKELGVIIGLRDLIDGVKPFERFFGRMHQFRKKVADFLIKQREEIGPNENLDKYLASLDSV